MALFKIFKGQSSGLPKTYKDGYCYFTTDDGKMYIDTKDSDSTGRICLNAGHADTATKDGNGNIISSTYLPLSGGSLNDSATLTITKYNKARKLIFDGDSIDFDLKEDTGGWAIALANLFDRTNTKHTLLGAMGTPDNGLTYLYMGGSYSDPQFKIDANGLATFKNIPCVGNIPVSLSNHTHNYLPLTGGTINGELRIGNNLELWTDSEGGNIRFITPNGNSYEIDNYDNDLRIYGVNNNALQGYWRFLKDGSFRSSGHIQTDNSFYSYKNNRTVGLQTDDNKNSCWINFQDNDNFTQITLVNETLGTDHIGHIYRKYNGVLEDHILFHSGNLGTFIHNYAIPKWGGELTGQIIKYNNGTWWAGGRDTAAIRCPSSGDNSWFPVTSCKTLSGDISNGVLGNTMYWVHTTDTEYAAGNNITSRLAWLDINGSFGASRIYGAVWNDYAEYRSCKEEFKPGQVVYENGDDTLSISNSRLQRGCSIVSDTFGFAIGETNEAKCPIAISGRVLAYGYEPREEFKKHIGWPVCSGPNGTVSIMTEEEEEKYPSRIIGTISAVPDYEEWGTENIKVNNRIWIKVK